MARRLLDWLFRDRTTGRVVVVQWPNAPLWTFIVAAVGRRGFQPEGTLGHVVSFIATFALVWWAVDEIRRGVNPFRRLLGVTFLVLTVVGLATR